MSSQSTLLFDMPMRLVMLCGVLEVRLVVEATTYRCKAFVKPFIAMTGVQCSELKRRWDG